MEFVERVKHCGAIAIVRGLRDREVVPVTEALYMGGIQMIEVTFDQANPESWGETLGAIRKIADDYPGKIYPGAGTVMSPEQVQMACDAGAQYIISPNVCEAVICKTRELGMGSCPGAMTPTEAVQAMECGAHVVKIFPAGMLGPEYIRALCAPLKHIPFVAVGGIHERNAADFLRAGAIGVGVGGNLVGRKWIDAGDFGQMTALARALVARVRGGE